MSCKQRHFVAPARAGLPHHCGFQYGVGTDEGPKTKYVYSKMRPDVAKRLASTIAERDKGLVFDSESLTPVRYLSEWLVSVA
jgi:hypothetical protein